MKLMFSVTSLVNLTPQKKKKRKFEVEVTEVEREISSVLSDMLFFSLSAGCETRGV